MPFRRRVRALIASAASLSLSSCDVGRIPSSPQAGITEVALDTSSNIFTPLFLGYVITPTGQTQTLYSNGAPQLGANQSFFSKPSGVHQSIYVAEGDMWQADTQFVVVFNQVRFGSTAPNCAFEGSSSEAWEPVNTYVTPGCPATWLEYNYHITKAFVQSPLVSSLSGPTAVVRGEQVTWTIQRSGGGPGGYAGYKMQTEPPGTNQYTLVCEYSQSCSYTIPANANSFWLHSGVGSTMHPNNCGIWCMEWVYQTTKTMISVAPPLSVGGGILGPATVSQGQVHTWSVNASGAYAPYTYAWRINNGGVVATASSLSASFEGYANYDISVDVFDAHGRPAFASLQIYVDGGCAPFCERAPAADAEKAGSPSYKVIKLTPVPTPGRRD
jgi:hypothetical protein